ncbi:metal ABC transporter permease [Afifella aestuarii]|uniref:metal ABC transporter permease n=1 Tax=Afifella aestuarii TaxID=1909496 RepID=UPI000FE2A6D0|nr:metal ABC transporter permease [Afifella aestuarii]
MNALDFALLPFALPFMREAMLIAVLVAVPSALLSCFLVLKGWSLMGDAISHAIFPGVVLAYLAGMPLVVGAFAAGMTCAIATGYLSQNSRIKQDTIMGIVFSGMFGFGLVLYTKIQSEVHLDHILFGNILGVLPFDLWQSAAIALLTVAIIAAKWRDLLLHAFDPQHARAIGLPVGLMHYGLLAILSLTIVGALKATGIILTIALLIAPGAIAFLVTRRFGPMMLVAVSLSVACAFLGVYASFFIDSAPAPTIVLLLAACFVVVFLATTLSGRSRDEASRATIKPEKLG